MSSLIEIPKIEANVTRATVVKWLVRAGDRVAVGDPLAEIETEKAVFVLEAPASGFVRRLLVDAGQKVLAGSCLGVIAGETEELPALCEPQVSLGDRASRTDEAIEDEYVLDEYSEALLE